MIDFQRILQEHLFSHRGWKPWVLSSMISKASDIIVTLIHGVRTKEQGNWILVLCHSFPGLLDTHCLSSDPVISRCQQWRCNWVMFEISSYSKVQGSSVLPWSILLLQETSKAFQSIQRWKETNATSLNVTKIKWFLK